MSRRKRSRTRVSHNSRRVKFSKNVRRRGSRSSVTARRSKSKQPSEGYEGIVLYYLSKLRKLFQPKAQVMINEDGNHPTPRSRENSQDTFDRTHVENKEDPKPILRINPAQYTSSNSPKPRKSMSRDSIKEKALDIVSAAIDYGYAHNVVKKKGNVFWFSRDRRGSSCREKLANRAPTPGPSASRCKFCKKQKIDPSRKARSMTLLPLNKTASKLNNATIHPSKSKSRSKSKSPTPFSGPSRSRTRSRSRSRATSLRSTSTNRTRSRSRSLTPCRSRSVSRSLSPGVGPRCKAKPKDFGRRRARFRLGRPNKSAISKVCKCRFCRIIRK